ncbi:hypothetical protein QBC39DRAFT_329546 [Podospora conica]|nr:hypothetical protein QBC39DRAFT_329546 [Schizothecium conicum]
MAGITLQESRACRMLILLQLIAPGFAPPRPVSLTIRRTNKKRSASRRSPYYFPPIPPSRRQLPAVDPGLTLDEEEDKDDEEEEERDSYPPGTIVNKEFVAGTPYAYSYLRTVKTVLQGASGYGAPRGAFLYRWCWAIADKEDDDKITNSSYLSLKFSPNTVALEVKGPKLADLNFYDLPGVFISAKRDEDTFLELIVKNLAY